MSHKLKVSYALTPADDKAKIAVEKLLKSMMDWVQLEDNLWLVLSNRHNAATLQEKLVKLLPARANAVVITEMKKRRINNEDGYIDAKNGQASERIFSTKS